MRVVWLAIATGTLAVASWALARCLVSSRLERVLAAGSLLLTFIVAVSLCVGWLGRAYRPVPLTIAAVVVGLGALAVTWRFPARRVQTPDATAGADATEKRAMGLAVRIVAMVTIAAAAIEEVSRIVVAAVLPPYGADTLGYHFTAIAGWVQAGRIGPNPISVFAAHYPMNGELLSGWSVVFLHDAALYNFTQILTGLLGAAAVTATARLFGVPRLLALSGGALFLLVPIVVVQQTSGYIDVTFTALLVLAVYWLLRLIVTLRAGASRVTVWIYGLLTATAIGLMLGTKVTGYVYGPLLLVVLAVVLARRPDRASRPVGGPVLWVCCLAVVVATGAVWAIYDLATVHNPVYPAAVNLGPLHLHGVHSATQYIETAPAEASQSVPVQVAHSWLHDAVIGSHGYDFYNYDQRSGGLGSVWIFLGLPALAIAAYYALRRRHPAAITALVILIIGFAAQPYRWWSRFTLQLAVAGIVALLWLIAHLGQRRLAAVLAGLAVVLSAYDAVFDSWRVNLGTHATVTTAQAFNAAFHGRRITFSRVLPTYGRILRNPTPVHVAVDGETVDVLALLYGGSLNENINSISTDSSDTLDQDLLSHHDNYAVVTQGSSQANVLARQPNTFHMVAEDPYNGTEVFEVLRSWTGSIDVRRSGFG